MQSLSLQLEGKSESAIAWILTALGITVVAVALEGYLLCWFYRYSERLSPGTEFNGFGLTLFLGLTSTASVVFGGVAAFVGAIISLTHRRWRLAALATVAFGGALIPWFTWPWAFRYIMTLRQLIPHP